jgi:putative transposase
MLIQNLQRAIKRLKGRSSRIIQKEYPELRKRYWGRHFWAIGYGAWSTGNVTEEMVQEYISRHKNKSNQESNKMKLEEQASYKINEF